MPIVNKNNAIFLAPKNENTGDKPTISENTMPNIEHGIEHNTEPTEHSFLENAGAQFWNGLSGKIYEGVQNVGKDLYKTFFGSEDDKQIHKSYVDALTTKPKGVATAPTPDHVVMDNLIKLFSTTSKVDFPSAVQATSFLKNLNVKPEGKDNPEDFSFSLGNIDHPDSYDKAIDNLDNLKKAKIDAVVAKYQPLIDKSEKDFANESASDPSNPFGALSYLLSTNTTKKDLEKQQDSEIESIQDQYNSVISNIVAPQKAKKAAIVKIDDLAISKFNSSKPEELLTDIENTNKYLKDVIKPFKDINNSKYGTSTQELDNTTLHNSFSNELYSFLGNNGIDLAYTGNNKKRDVAKGNFNYDYSKEFDFDLFVNSSNKIEKDKYVFKGLKDQLDITDGYLKATQGAYDKENNRDVSGLSREQLNYRLKILSGLQGNIDNLNTLKRNLTGWGDTNLKGYKQYLGTQDEIKKLADEAPISTTVATFLKTGGEMLVKNPMQFTIEEKIALGDRGEEQVTTSPDSKRTTDLASILQARVTTDKLSDIEPEIVDKVTGLPTKLSEASAINIFDKKGKFVGLKNVISPRPLFYQTMNTGFGSLLLGGFGAIGEQLGAKMIGLGGRGLQIGTTGVIGATVERNLAKAEFANITGQVGYENAYNAANAGIATLKFGVRSTSMIVPTAFIYGDGMYRNFIDQGFSPKQSSNLTKWSVIFEGGSEAFFGNEIKFYNALLGDAENIALKATATEMLQKGLAARMKKQFGRAATQAEISYAEKFWISLQKFKNSRGVSTILAAGAPMVEEPTEEVLTNFANYEVTDKIAKGFDSSYKGEDFTVESQINTIVNTIGTMPFMPFTAGINHLKNQKIEAVQARYEIGSAPEVHIGILKEQFNSNKITKQEYEAKVNAVNEYKSFKNLSDDITEITSKQNQYSKNEKDNLNFSIFSTLIKKDALQKQLLTAITDEQKAAFVEAIDDNENQLFNYINKGLYSSKEERIKANMDNLDYLFNPESIKGFNSTNAKSTIATLKEQQANETTPALIQKYQEKIKLLQNQVAEASKTNTQKAAVNNSNKTISIDSPSYGRMTFKLGVPYHITTDKKSTTGKLLRTRPIITIEKDNGDGTVTISYKGKVIEKSPNSIPIEEFKLYNKEAKDNLVYKKTPNGWVAINKKGEEAKVEDKDIIEYYEKFSKSKLPTREIHTKVIPKQSLDKFRFTEQAEVQNWRDSKDPRAFVFDNDHAVFSYTFNKPTESREITQEGRIRYNSNKKAVEFVYKNRQGKESTYVIDSYTLDQYKQGKGKLKLVRELETDREYSDRVEKSRASAEKINFEKLSAQSSRRLGFIIDYIEEKKNSLLAIKKIISESEDKQLDVEIEINKFQEQLNNIEDIRTVSTKKVRANVKKLIDELRKLQNKHNIILKTIEDLNTEKQSLEDELEYLSKYKDNDFESTTPLTEQLMKDLLDLDEQKNQVSDTISMLEDLVKGIKNTIDKALDIINSLISGFEKKYGKERTALTKEDVFEVIGVNRVVTKAYGEEASFLKSNPEYLKNVEKFQQLLEENLDKIDLSEAEIDDFKKSIKANMELYDKIAKKISYQESLIKAAEQMQAKYFANSMLKKIQGFSNIIFKSFLDNQSTNYVDDSTEETDKKESAKMDIRDLFAATTGISNLSDPRTYRLQTFLNKVADIKNYRLLAVTKDNASKLGLESVIFSNDKITNKTDKEDDNDIVLVVVKVVNNKIKYVDFDGNLTDIADPATIVSTSMKLAELSWSEQYGNEVKYIDKGEDLTEAQLLERGEPFRIAHARFRQFLIDSIKKGSMPRLAIKGISRGFDTQKNTTPQVATVVANLPETVNLANTQVVFIPSTPTGNTGSVTYQGTNSTIKMPKGIPVFSWKQAFFFLNNRKFNSKDVLKYQKLFRHLVDKVIEGDKTEVEKVIKFLEKTLYLRNPNTVSNITDAKQQTPLGRSQIWLSKDKDDNIVLHLHDLPGIALNYEDDNNTIHFAIESFFNGAESKGIYHNIDARDLVGKEFVEYYLDNNNSIKSRVWPSYQSYLISDKLPNKTNRPLDEIPLTTTLAPSTEDTPNKTGRYIVYENEHNEKVAEANPSKVSTTPTAKSKVNSDGKKLIKVREIGSPSKGDESIIYLWETRKDPMQKEPTYSIAFGRSAGQFYILKTEGLPINPQTNKPYTNASILESLNQNIQKNYKEQAPTVTVYELSEPEQEAPAIQEPVITTEEPAVKPSTSENTIIIEDNGPKVKFSLKNKGKTPDSEPKAFRVARNKTGYTLENLELAKIWWNERYPNIPFRIVEGLVDGIAFGAIHNHSLTLSNLAEVGTVYHEAFEAVAAYFLTGRELKDLRNEFRRREGSFTEYATGKTVKYSEATTDQIREQLAEEYRDYAMSDGKVLFNGQMRKKSLFDTIREWLSFLFGNPETVKDVFEKINNAKYKDKVPFGIKVTDAKYRTATQVDNPVLFREVMNGMTNLLFHDLRVSNLSVLNFLARSKKDIATKYKSIKSDIDEFYGGKDMIDIFEPYKTKEDLKVAISSSSGYNKVVEKLLDKASYGFATNIINKFGEELSVGDVASIYDIIQNYKDITSNWPEYVQSHKEFLSYYKIEFKEGSDTIEDEDIKEEDENKDKNDYYVDMLKFSVKENANTEIKMLVATLVKLKYAPGYYPIEGILPTSEDIIPELNSMLMEELVDYGKFIGTLLSKFIDSNTFDDMVDVIRREALTDPTYQGLLTALKVDDAIETLPFEQQKYVVDLRNKFFTSLNNMKPKSLVLILDNTDGTGSSIDVNDANAIRIIKQKWLSALKDQKRRLIKYVKTPRGEEMVFDTSKFGVPNITKERDLRIFLNNLGIDFNIGFERLTEEEIESIINATQALHKLLSSTNADSILFENKLSSESLTKLATVYSKYSDFYNESQHLHVEGEPIQNIITHNFLGIITKVFNSATSLSDLIAKIPQYTQSDRNSYITSSQILNKGTLFFNNSGQRTKDIQVLILEGATTRDEGDGIGTSSLEESDFIAQEFSHNLKGNWYTMIPADIKTEWGISLGHFVTQIQSTNDEFVASIMRKHLAAEILTAQQSKNSNVKNVKNYGLRLRQFEEILKSADKDFKLPLSYDKTPDQIINENLGKINEAIKAHFEKESKKTFDYFIENNIINPYVKIEEGAEASISYESDNTKESNKFSILMTPSSFIGEGLSMDQIKELIKFREINYQLNIIEQYKLFWGDPAQWSQIEKRTKPFVSGRNLSVHSAPYFNNFNNTYGNIKTFTDKNGKTITVTLQPGEPGHISYDDNLRVQSMEDIIQISEHSEVLFNRMLDQNSIDVFKKPFNKLTKPQVKKILDFYTEDGDYTKKEDIINPYESNNEADGQAWSFPTGYKEIRQRSNTWSDAADEQFEWDMALFRLDNDLYSKDSRGEDLKAYDVHLRDKGNPYLNRAKEGKDLPIQQVLKPIYSGFKNGDVMNLDIRKMSIANLNWRLVKGTALEPLYKAHVLANTTFINAESANKIGLITDIEPMYKDGKANTTVEHEKLSYKYFGIQVETEAQKDKATLGTQLTKLAILNLLINGVPLDFIKANSTLTKLQVKSKWNSLKESVKLETSNHYKLVRNNSLFLSAMKIKAKESLFKEFGLESVEYNGIKSINFKSIDKFERLLQRELKNRQAPENIKDAAKLIIDKDGNKVFNVPLDLQIGSDKLEAIITSMIDKSLLRPKMFGGQLPQISSALFEQKLHSRELVYKDKSGKYKIVEDISKLNAKEKKSIRLTANDLKFYTPEEPWIEVRLPFYMKEFIEEGVELKISDLPDELKWAIGFRIPSQELNSIEHIKIKSFLPVEYGNSIVVPTEITTKAGSDFDIDKLNIYLYNYTIKNGKPVKIEYSSTDSYDTNGGISRDCKNRYNEWLREEVKDYGAINKDVKRDSPEYQEVQRQLNESFEEYANELSKLKEETLTPYSTKLDEIREKIKNGQDVSQDIFSQGFSIFRSLPISIRVGFMGENDEMDAKIKNSEMESFDKTIHFKLLALEFIDIFSTTGNQIVKYTNKKGERVEQPVNAEKVIPIFKSLISNYDMYLTSIGWTKETIDEFNENLNNLKDNKEAYKEFKESLRSNLLDNTKKSLLTDFTDLFNKTLADVYNLYSLEEFATLPVELQNTKKAIDNGYIDNLRELLSLEDNFAQLIQPNSVTILQREAYAMNYLWRNTKASKKNPASYLSSSLNAFTRLAFLVGKSGVGIGAAAQTLHAVSQMLGTSIYEKVDDVIPFNFPTNSYIDPITNFRHFDFSAKLTTDKVPISNIISAFINAFVDVAKDPWILGINGNQATAGIYITAFKLGMPVKETVRWFNQPVIKDYIKLVQKSKSISASLSGTKMDKPQILALLGQKYGFATEGYKIATTDRKGNYTVEELDGYVKEWLDQEETKLITNRDGDVINDKTEGTSLSFKENQGNLLAEFIKLESISWDLFRFGQALNHDTYRTVSFDSIRNKFGDVEIGLAGPFKESILKAMSDTFIGTILIGKVELLEGMRSQYLTEQPAARAILNPMINHIFTSTGKKDVKEKIVKDMRKEFLTYLLHTIPISINGKNPVTLTSAIKDLFKGDKSLADRIRKMQIESMKDLTVQKVNDNYIVVNRINDEILGTFKTQEKATEYYDAHKEPSIPKNFLVQNMLGVIPALLDKVSSIKNVSLLRRMTDKIDADHASSDWTNLGNHPLTRDIMFDLIKFGLLQNGLKGGPGSFTHLIPNEVFSSMAKQVDDYFNNADILKLTQGFESSYYQNNWWNKNLVPRYKPNASKLNSEGKTVKANDYRQPIAGFPKMIYKWAEPENGVSNFKPSKVTRNSKYLLVSEIKKEGDPEYPEDLVPVYSKAEREKMKKKGDYSFLSQILYKRLEIVRETPYGNFSDVPLYKSESKGYVNHYVVFYPVARYGKKGELIEHYAEPSLSQVNESIPGLIPASNAGIYRNLENIAGMKTGRFLSDVIGKRADDEDISLSLRPDLQQQLKKDLSQALSKNITLFESSTTAMNIAKSKLENPNYDPQNKPSCPF